MSSVPDNYEINIAKKEDCTHWGKVEIPDYDEQTAKEKLEFLRGLFGDEYYISMIHWKCRGYEVS